MPLTCQDCGRPLRDPESRAAGRGPVCAAKYHGSRGAAGHDQLIFEETPMDQTETPSHDPRRWRGATELVPDREVQRLAAAGLVGYRQDRGRLLHCLAHKPAPASRHADFHEVSAEDLPDGGICVHPTCGADLLASLPAYGAPTPHETAMFEKLRSEARKLKDQREAELRIAVIHEVADVLDAGGNTYQASRVREIAQDSPRPPAAAVELAELRDALHQFRFMLDRGKGRPPVAAEYWREVLDECTGSSAPPCDSTQQHARAQRAEATLAAVRALHQPVDRGDAGQVCAGCLVQDPYTAHTHPCPTTELLVAAENRDERSPFVWEEVVRRTARRMEDYVDAGCRGVNPRQVIDLLSPTWPDGNFEAPILAPEGEASR
jgi:hypothetical protein